MENTRWIPNVGDTYYYVIMDRGVAKVITGKRYSVDSDFIFNAPTIFKDKESADILCNNINTLIEQNPDNVVSVSAVKSWFTEIIGDKVSTYMQKFFFDAISNS